MPIEYSEVHQASVTLDFFGDRPVFLLNEYIAYESPESLVAFEYFAACELARRFDGTGFRAMQSDPALAERMLAEADCRALSLVEARGYVRGFEAYSAIIDQYQYYRAKDEYLGVPFWLRAENITRMCGR